MDDINIKLSADIQDLLTKFQAVDKEMQKIVTDAAKAGRTITDSMTGQKITTDQLNKSLSTTATQMQAVNTQTKAATQQASLGATAFNKLAAQIALAFSVQQVVAFTKATITAYAEAEKAEQSLLFALDKRVDVQERLLAQSKEIQNTTIFSDEDVINAQTFLALQGRTEEQIKKTIEAAKGLATVQGTDLQTAVTKLDATYEGSVRGLGRLEKSIVGLTDAEYKSGVAVDILGKKYAGLAEEVGQTTAGQIERAKNSWGELQEGLGAVIVQLFEGADGTNTLSDSLQTQGDLLKNENIPAFQRLLQLFSPVANGQYMVLDAIDKSIESVTKYNKLLNENVIAYAKSIGITNLQEAAQFAQGKTLSQLVSGFNQYIKSSKEATTTQAETLNVLTMTNEQLEEIIGNTDDYSEAERKRAKKQLEANKKSIELAKERKEALIKLQEEEDELLLELITDAEEKEYAEEVMAFNRQRELYKDNAEMLELAEQVHLKKMEDIRLKYLGTLEDFGEEETKLTGQTQAEILASQMAFMKKSTALTDAWVRGQKKSFDDLVEEELKRVKDNFFDALPNTISDVLGGVADRVSQAREERVNKSFEVQSKALEQQKERDLITEEEYNKRSEALEEQKQKKLAEIRRKQAVTDRALALFNIAINTAASVMKTVATLGAIPAAPLLPYIYGLGALQAAAVLAQPLPKFKQGGKVEGRTHEQGGQLVEAEGGEWFINRNSSAKYDTVLAELNKDNSFGAIRELAKLNGITLDMKIKRDLDAKEAFIAKQEVSLKEVPELREMLRIMKQTGTIVERGNGYRIERFGNVERKINEA